MCYCLCLFVDMSPFSFSTHDQFHVSVHVIMFTAHAIRFTVHVHDSRIVHGYQLSVHVLSSCVQTSSSCIQFISPYTQFMLSVQLISSCSCSCLVHGISYQSMYSVHVFRFSVHVFSLPVHVQFMLSVHVHGYQI